MILLLAFLAGCATPQPPATLQRPAPPPAVNLIEPPPETVVTIFITPPLTGLIQSSTDLQTWVRECDLTNASQVTVTSTEPKLFFRSLKSDNGVQLAWNQTTDPSVTGYNVYWGGASGAYTNFADVGMATNVVIWGLTPEATYYFAATCYASGMESPFSNEAVYTVPIPVLAIRNQ